MACIKKRRGKWVVDYRDSQGRRHWETKPNKKTAQDRLAEILTSEQPEQPIETRTFQEYGDWWLQTVAKVSIKASTFQEYEAVLRNHIYPLLRSIPFLEVKRPQIRQLIAAKKAEGYEQSTISNMIAPLRSMYNQAIEDGITEKNPGGRIGKLNKRDKDKPKKKINPLTREEIQTMLKTAETDKYRDYYPLFLCAPRSGIRQGELVSLRGIDVDFNSRFIHVQRNLSRGKIAYRRTARIEK